MDQDIALFISTLQKKRDEFRRKASEIDVTIAQLEGVFGVAQVPAVPLAVSSPAERSPAHPPAAPSHSPGMSIAQAAIKVLSVAGRPLKTRIIADALEHDGFKSTNLYRAVYNGLRARTDVEFDDLSKRWNLKPAGGELENL